MVAFKIRMDDEIIEKLVKELQAMSEHNSLNFGLQCLLQKSYFPGGDGHYYSIDPHKYPYDTDEDPIHIRKEFNDWYADYLENCAEEDVNPAISLDDFPTVMAYVAYQEEMHQKAVEESERIEKLRHEQ